METITTQVSETIVNIVVAVVISIIGYVGVKAKEYLSRKSNDSTRHQVIADAVRFVEQVFWKLDGAEKYKKVVAAVSQELGARGVPFHEEQIKTLIESAVYEIKNGVFELSPGEPITAPPIIAQK